MSLIFFFGSKIFLTIHFKQLVIYILSWQSVYGIITRGFRVQNILSLKMLQNGRSVDFPEM
jgi:hypothetical protein